MWLGCPVFDIMGRRGSPYAWSLSKVTRASEFRRRAEISLVQLDKALVISPARPMDGGLGTAAAAAAEGLQACGLAVDFATLPLDRSFAQRLAGHRPLRRYPRIGRALTRGKLARTVRRADWDVAYAMPGSLPDRPIRILHQATFHPRTVMGQLAEARRRAGGGRGPMSRAEARQYGSELDQAELVRVESRAVAESLMAHGVDPAKIVHAPPGVDLERFRAEPKPEELRVAFVGTLSLWKGLDVLVETERALRGIATVSVIGGPVCSWSKRIAAAARFDRTATDLAGLLSRSHVLVLPSASDGFGYVVLEALASGCVPIVTSTVGAAEVVHRLGSELVVDAEHFAAAVRDLVPALGSTDLSERSRRLAEEFAWDAMARSAGRALLCRLADSGHLPRK